MFRGASPEAKSWVKSAISKLKKSGVVVDLPDTNLLEYSPGQFCSGFFEDEEPKLACATGRGFDIWFPIFVHEYCHFEQWKYNRKWWDGHLIDGREGLDLAIEAWSEGRDVPLTQIVHWCMSSASAEIDCERRVIEKIKSEDLPIPVKEYARKANSYIAFYYAMPELKSWCNGDRPYDVDAIMEMMPDHMELSHKDYWGLAHKAMDLYREHCL
jgi:hypothetical protein